MARNSRLTGKSALRSAVTVLAAASLVVGVLAATAGATPQSDNADAQKNAGLVKTGPMTPEKAALLGKNVDFGPNCDTTTGRVKIPSVYSPPCIQPFSGRNSGATASGVTDQDIKVVVLHSFPTRRSSDLVRRRHAAVLDRKSVV